MISFEDIPILPRSSSLQTHRQTTLRLVALPTSLIFVAAGLLKLLAPLLHPGANFGEALAQTPTPFPRFFGVFIPLLEVCAGTGLLFPKTRRFCALPLAGDMVAAILLVGIPGRMGHPIEIAGEKIGAEAWRLPLEIGLLAALGLLMVNRQQGSETRA